MGSATSRNGPGRRHNVRLSASGGASMIVAGSISETAASRLAEALNDFLAAALGGPRSIPSRCQRCAAEIRSAGQGRLPSYCSPACRQQAYRDRRRSREI
jgi:hypothetical protein